MIEKSQLRQQMRAAVRSLTEDQKNLQANWVNQALLEKVASLKKQPKEIMAYQAMDDEVDLSVCISTWRDQGIQVIVPEDFQTNQHIITPDVVLVPGLAFDWQGHRLGRGRGWYDLFLASLPKTVHVWGVCFREQLVKNGVIPFEKHDMNVNDVVTMSR
jgi:5-formyltetrahydrofolate cyclo-ligase